MRTKTLTLLVMLIASSSFAAPAGAGPPTESYGGPLVETHAHIVIYQSLTESDVQYRVKASERASELSVASYVAGLDRNGIKCTLGFHGIAVDDDKQQELLDHARRLLLLYPDRFVLFAEIFRNNPLEWFDVEKLDPLLREGVFSGFGEVQFANPPLHDGGVTVLPDDPIFLGTDDVRGIYDALSDLGLFVMAHPASRSGLERAVQHDPKLTWIIHGPHVHTQWTEIEKLDELLTNNDNLYYTLDIGESLPEFFELTKQLNPRSGGEFLKVLNRDFDHLLERMVSTWGAVIEKHPDRFLWGTDMALPPWHWHASVFDMIVKFSRAFVGRLEPGAGKNYAYKNAERLLGDCKYSADIPVPIDVRPDSFPNTIDPEVNENIPVAILSSPRFDAPIQVDASSLTFGHTGDEASLAFCNASPVDANGDGLPDLICHFHTENANFQTGDKKGILKGKTKGGRTVEGRDWVRILEN